MLQTVIYVRMYMYVFMQPQVDVCNIAHAALKTSKCKDHTESSKADHIPHGCLNCARQHNATPHNPYACKLLDRLSTASFPFCHIYVLYIGP